MRSWASKIINFCTIVKWFKFSYVLWHTLYYKPCSIWRSIMQKIISLKDKLCQTFRWMAVHFHDYPNEVLFFIVWKFFSQQPSGIRWGNNPQQLYRLLAQLHQLWLNFNLYLLRLYFSTQLNHYHPLTCLMLIIQMILSFCMVEFLFSLFVDSSCK